MKKILLYTSLTLITTCCIQAEEVNVINPGFISKLDFDKNLAKALALESNSFIGNLWANGRYNNALNLMEKQIQDKDLMMSSHRKSKNEVSMQLFSYMAKYIGKRIPWPREMNVSQASINLADASEILFSQKSVVVGMTEKNTILNKKSNEIDSAYLRDIRLNLAAILVQDIRDNFTNNYEPIYARFGVMSLEEEDIYISRAKILSASDIRSKFKTANEINNAFHLATVMSEIKRFSKFAEASFCKELLDEFPHDTATMKYYFAKAGFDKKDFYSKMTSNLVKKIARRTTNDNSLEYIEDEAKREENRK